MTYRLARFYIDRHPSSLRELVSDSIPADFDVRSVSYSDSEALQREILGWCEVALFAPGRLLPDDVIQAASQCKLFQLWSSGYDKFNVAAASRMGIPVANNGGGNAASVAEHTILLMLAVCRNFLEQVRRAKTGAWEGNAHGMDARMLLGKTLGIIGLGAIGKEVASRAAAFGMNVLYFDVVRQWRFENTFGVTYVDFRELLRLSDVISLHVHSTQATARLLNRSSLAETKPGVFIINTARGELIDEGALLEALESEHVAGVGLDAFRVEPTEPNDPLLSHPRVIPTPHYSSTVESYVSMLESCVSNLLRACRGKAPKFIIN